MTFFSYGNLHAVWFVYIFERPMTLTHHAVTYHVNWKRINIYINITIHITFSYFYENLFLNLGQYFLNTYSSVNVS